MTETPPKSPTVPLTAMVGMVAVMTTIAISSIPWAFSMHGRLSSIETRLQNLQVPPPWFQAQVESLSARLDRLEDRVDEVERYRSP